MQRRRREDALADGAATRPRGAAPGVRAVLQWTREYCLATGQHGYRYLAESGLHFSERVLWISVIVASIGTSVYIVSITWTLFWANPTLTVIEDSQYNTWNFPFPAVTLCGVNQLDLFEAKTFVSKLILPEETNENEILEDIRYLATFFELTAGEKDRANLTRLQRVLDMNEYAIRDVMRKLSPSCKQMVLRCMWKGRVLVKCFDYLRDIKTFEGFCCTFNYVALNDKDIKLSQLEMSAKRLSACGKATGLSLVLNNDLDAYFDTMLASHGLKIMIHSELNYPDSNAAEVIVRPGRQTFLSVSPLQTYSTSDVNDIAVERRHCRFPNEGTVEAMRNYTFNNCVMDCRKKLMLKLCNCYAFFFPGTKISKTCNLTDLICLSRNKKLIFGFEEVDFFTKITDYRDLPKPCNCLPECDVTEYRVQTSSMPFKPQIREDLDNKFFSGLNPKNHTLLHVFYVDLVGTRYRQDAYLGWLDLIASVGGLLSLMLGFSIISGFETVYFFTIRVLCSAFLKRRRAVEASAASTLAPDPVHWKFRPAPRTRAPKGVLQAGGDPYVPQYAPNLPNAFLRPPAGHGPPQTFQTNRLTQRRRSRSPSVDILY